MIRFCASLLCCLVFAVNTLEATPSEDYVWVYSLIQEGERHEEANRKAEALAVYLEAQKKLTDLSRSHPSWNPRVVDYRLRHVEARIEKLRPVASVSGEVGPSGAAPGQVAASSADVENLNTEILQLNRDLAQLRSDNSTLQAKLQEALSVRPAAVDPRKLEQVEEQNLALTKEVEVLRSELAATDSTSAEAADPAEVEELRAELERETQRARSARTGFIQ